MDANRPVDPDDGEPKPPAAVEPPPIAVSPPIRRSPFRFGILFMLLLTSVLAVFFAVARLPKKYSDEQFPNIIVTKRGMWGRETTYEVRFAWGVRERYQTAWEGDVETLTGLYVQDYRGARHFGTESSGSRMLLTAGHRRAFDAVRAMVRSKVDFDAMSWADERPLPGGSAGPRAPFTATIFPEVAPPRADSLEPKPSATPSSTSP
jgi:hypothetical protein